MVWRRPLPEIARLMLGEASKIVSNIHQLSARRFFQVFNLCTKKCYSPRNMVFTIKTFKFAICISCSDNPLYHKSVKPIPKSQKCPPQGVSGTVQDKGCLDGQWSDIPGQRCSGDVFVQVSYETMRLYGILQGILHGHTKRNTTRNKYMEYYQVCWGFPKATAGSCSKPWCAF